MPSKWAGPDSEVARHVVEQSRRCLEAYSVNPLLVRQDANIERATAQGGYGRRQIYELVQNGADALIGHPPGRIHLLLTDQAMYCANEGNPIDVDGVDAILTSHISMKRGTEIGRFGLGFKSVLGVSDSPAFFSRSGSFGFHSSKAEERIREVVPDAERIPTLRLGEPISAAGAATADPDLAGLMEWATTIVRLPRSLDDSKWLSEDISRFPPEFLLFSSHVGVLSMDDRTSGLRREIILKRSGSKFRLEEDGNASEWRVLSTLHTPTDSARKDAGELADRQSIPLIWAVPLKGRTARGQFWAFFPTESYTTLSGILNAPWKTNEDRQNLLPGPFNEELLRVASRMVVDGIPDLIQRRDPARFLDTFPARGREAPNWADASLTESVYRLASKAPSLPDQKGEPALPSTLRIHPPGLHREWLDAWAECPGRPINWCHPSVETKDRRPRADRLMSRAPSSLVQWLEALVEDHSPTSSIAALRLAARIVREAPELASDVARAGVALTETGELMSTQPGRVFLRSKYDPVGLEVNFLHKNVSRAAEVKDALTVLGIGTVDAYGELESVVATAFSGWRIGDWDNFWTLVRRVGHERSVALIRSRVDLVETRLHVRTLDGRYRPIQSALLPGPIVPGDGTRDKAVAIDVNFHADDLPALTALGAIDSPRAGRGSSHEPWFREYRWQMQGRYYEELPKRSPRPQEHLLVFDAAPFPGPLTALADLSPEGRALFTELVFAAAGESRVVWELRHKSVGSYPLRGCEAPWLWQLRRHGALHTTLGPAALGDCLDPALLQLKAFMPVAITSPDVTKRLGLVSDLAHVSPDQWRAAFSRLGFSIDDEAIGCFYGLAAFHLPAPETIRCRVGLSHDHRQPAEVTVVSSRRELEALVTHHVPTVLCEDETAAQLLIDKWGLRPSAQSVRTEVRAVPSADAVPLIDEFPSLRLLLDDAAQETRIIRCENLEIQTVTDAGRTAEPKRFLFDGGDLYWLDDQGDVELLGVVSDQFGLGLSPDDCRNLLSQQAEQRRRDNLVRIREAVDDAARMVLALGAAAIRRRLPAGLVDAISPDDGIVADEQIARLAIAVYGVDVLKAFREELAGAGLEPPVQWSGSRSARTFVRDLGFPPEYAGFSQAKRDPILEVDGPADLPPLHDFQARIAESARAVLRTEGGTRALLSMPTGAGKTRVAVEALIRAVEEDGFAGPVLWIAQSDELCEQAVQTWAYVWRAVGPERRLVLSRFWASNEAVPSEVGSFHVVVATIDKLQGCLRDDAYDWLSLAEAVIVDEAHGSTTPSYTNVLDWLGLGRRQDRCPLIGLTATPFRGTSEEQTKRLVGRYGGRRLDHGVLPDDPYVELQRRGVLAQVRHELLAGSDISLTDSELAYLREFRRLPKSVEEHLGTDRRRNALLVDSIRALPSDWTILLFATSVDNAQTIAAMLTLQGVASATVSGETEPGARRHYVEEFRRGRIRVLTNYNVLTQGFDAPAVRAVYVARPTYSPNLYQQMIGRGLRGPMNGGKDECLIVNVEDNVRQYGEDLAFRQFEYLWTAV